MKKETNWHQALVWYDGQNRNSHTINVHTHLVININSFMIFPCGLGSIFKMKLPCAPCSGGMNQTAVRILIEETILIKNDRELKIELWIYKSERNHDSIEIRRQVIIDVTNRFDDFLFENWIEAKNVFDLISHRANFFFAVHKFFFSSELLLLF